VITSAQVRAARALLGWQVRELAHRAVVSISAVHAIEGGAGPPSVSIKKLANVQAALEAEGIEFASHGDVVGVWLHPKKVHGK
jgi:transcriptional regulator with XRE-family HTH domain